jgi:RNA methyltransferase, TrmH family
LHDITNAERKLIEQLQTTKFRKKLGFFVAEGTKIVDELCHERPDAIELIVATGDWLVERPLICSSFDQKIAIALQTEFKTLSAMVTPPQVLVIAKQFEHEPATEITDLTLVLETIQDPGNMGAILRIADWFGVKRVFCTPDCVDIYNPKVVQASMGSLWRVAVEVAEVQAIHERFPTVPMLGAMLHGENVFKMTLPNPALLVMGNESKGIAHETDVLLTHQITIPQFGAAESLNVAIATGILVAEWRR